MNYILGFEGSWPQDIAMTWGSAVIQVGEHVYNSILKDRWIDADEMPHEAITSFSEPVPIATLVPLWVVAMDRNSNAERLYGPKAYEALSMGSSMSLGSFLYRGSSTLSTGFSAFEQGLEHGLSTAMALPPQEMYLQKDPSQSDQTTLATFMFLTPEQFSLWRKFATQQGLDLATTVEELSVPLGLAPRNLEVHVKRWLLSDRRNRVRATAKGLLSPQDFETYLQRIAQ